MVDILVADDNIYYTKTLINSINEKNIYTRLCAIATNGKEVLEKIKKGDNSNTNFLWYCYYL